jgi:tetratricopeptide (TPR) repeat protein
LNTWFFYIILLVLNIRSLTNVSERNLLKSEASAAFVQKKYSLSVEKYQNLSNISFNLEPEARLNLAHAYFFTNDTTKALNEYRRLLKISDEPISSSALTQFGVINTMLGDSATALMIFKKALQQNPENKAARYNYELLRKKMPKPTPPKNNQNQDNQAEEQNPNNGGETEKTEEKQEDLDSQTPEKMSKEKALQILDAMKTNELQYSQQRKKTGKKIDKNAKDW